MTTTTTEYRVSTEKGERQTRVRVIGPDQGRVFAATVHHAQLDTFGGPQRASVNWPSIGSVEPAAAEAVADAIKRAASLAAGSDKRPVGLSPKYGLGPDQKLRVEHPEVRRIVAEKATSANANVRRDAASVWAYTGAEYDWELGEPVYAIGIGAQVVYRVPESAISPA